VSLAAPLALFGALLLVSVWMSRRLEHPLTQAFYRRFRPIPVRTPPDNTLTAVTGWGVAELAAAGVIAATNPDPVVAVIAALGSIAVGGLTTLTVA